MRLAFWRTLRKLDKEFVVSGECYYYTQSYPIYNSLSIYWYIVCSILSKDSETFVENLRLAQPIYVFLCGGPHAGTHLFTPRRSWWHLFQRLFLLKRPMLCAFSPVPLDTIMQIDVCRYLLPLMERKCCVLCAGGWTPVVHDKTRPLAVYQPAGTSNK